MKKLLLALLLSTSVLIGFTSESGNKVAPKKRISLIQNCYASEGGATAWYVYFINYIQNTGGTIMDATGVQFVNGQYCYMIWYYTPPVP